MSAPSRGTGILFVISAPSGTGKSTLAARLLGRVEGLEFSVSYTTRAPRPGEQSGKDYHFTDRDRFEEMIASRAFLEWANVFGNYYGTGLSATRERLERGVDLLLDIDIQGARQVRQGVVPAVSIMILPPDYATLESRLQARGSEGDSQRNDRLALARGEAEEYANFDYMVVNNELEETADELEAIVRAERRRSDRLTAEAGRILSTFPS
jgi:guanylate kinase